MQGMRDDRDIQWPKPASAPEKGRGPLCGKDRRSATVCPCRCVPTCYSFPTKACQVACSTSHLTQNPGENVPGDTFLPSTWHDVHADVLAAGCNLNGEAPSFRPKPGRRKQRSGSHEMDATERKPPDTSSQTQATMQLYDTVALWHDGRSYSSRIMIPSIGGTVTLICF